MKLNTLRIKIDKLDKHLLQILQKRMDLVVQIGKIKKQKKLSTQNLKREDEIKKNVQQTTRALKMRKAFTTRLFNEILRESRRLQK